MPDTEKIWVTSQYYEVKKISRCTALLRARFRCFKYTNDQAIFIPREVRRFSAFSRNDLLIPPNLKCFIKIPNFGSNISITPTVIDVEHKYFRLSETCKLCNLLNPLHSCKQPKEFKCVLDKCLNLYDTDLFQLLNPSSLQVITL